MLAPHTVAALEFKILLPYGAIIALSCLECRAFEFVPTA